MGGKASLSDSELLLQGPKFSAALTEEGDLLILCFHHYYLKSNDQEKLGDWSPLKKQIH